MYTRDYVSLYKKLLTPEITASLLQIHELKGRQNLIIEITKPL